MACWKITPLRIFCGLTDKLGCLDGALRMPALACDVVLGAVALTLICVALAGVSSYDNTIKLTSWAYVKNDLFETYSNLWGITVSLGDKWDSCTQYYLRPCPWPDIYQSCWYYTDICRSISWDDLEDQIAYKNDMASALNTSKITAIGDTTMANLLHAESYASDCNDSANANQVVVIILFITSIIKLVIRCARPRFNKETDVGKKCSTLLSTIIPVALNIGNVAAWHNNCIDALNDEPYNLPTFNETKCVLPNCPVKKVLNRILDEMSTQKGEWKPGPGYICLCVSLGCMILQFFIHLFVPAAPIPTPGEEEAKAGDVQIEAGRA